MKRQPETQRTTDVEEEGSRGMRRESCFQEDREQKEALGPHRRERGLYREVEEYEVSA